MSSSVVWRQGVPYECQTCRSLSHVSYSDQETRGSLATCGWPFFFVCSNNVQTLGGANVKIDTENPTDNQLVLQPAPDGPAWQSTRGGKKLPHGKFSAAWTYAVNERRRKPDLVVVIMPEAAS